MIQAEKKEIWLRHLRLWKESGLSANRYSIENDLNKNTFRYWVVKDKRKIKLKKSFVKLDLQKPVSVKEKTNLLLHYGSFEINIPTGFNKSDLECLLVILEERIKCS